MHTHSQVAHTCAVKHRFAYVHTHIAHSPFSIPQPRNSSKVLLLHPTALATSMARSSVCSRFVYFCPPRHHSLKIGLSSRARSNQNKGNRSEKEKSDIEIYSAKVLPTAEAANRCYLARYRLSNGIIQLFHVLFNGKGRSDGGRWASVA